jgi:hypothetical protein
MDKNEIDFRTIKSPNNDKEITYDKSNMNPLLWI